ncbi:MAG: STAS domain-containing protein [Pirellulaceae bacterium]|nr:STAS domain-containing protein [Planctomycetales bacterium]
MAVPDRIRIDFGSEDHVLTVVIEGSRGALAESLQHLSDKRNEIETEMSPEEIRLDMAGCTAVDSTDLNCLVQTRLRLGPSFQRFSLVNVNRPIREVIQLTRLDRLVHLAPAVDE